MKHAHYDQLTGKILGFYADDIHQNIPEPAIELTEDEWQDSLANRKIVQDGVLVAAPEPKPSPELTPTQKLAASGLTVEELKELLGLTQ